MLNPREFPHDPSRYAVIYHWWTASRSIPVHRQFAYPVVQSIATVRFQHPEVAIYVMDYSRFPSDWGDFPSRMNFEVIRQRCGLNAVQYRNPLSAHEGFSAPENRMILEQTSRSIDVWALAERIPERYIIFNDSDIFWARPALPSGWDSRFFYCRPGNTGFFIFDKTSRNVEHLFHSWNALSMLACRSQSFRRRLFADYPYYLILQDELTYIYLRDTNQSLFRDTVRDLSDDEVASPQDSRLPCPKRLHTRFHHYGYIRGKIPAYLKEFNPALLRFFTSEEYQECYGNVESTGSYCISDLYNPKTLEGWVGTEQSLAAQYIELYEAHRHDQRDRAPAE